VWENRYHLHRAGVTLGSLQAGDWIIVNGHPNRDPEDHSLAQLLEIRRPADGWRWVPGRVTTGNRLKRPRWSSLDWDFAQRRRVILETVDWPCAVLANKFTCPTMRLHIR
jgi:hypothetical protein